MKRKALFQVVASLGGITLAACGGGHPPADATAAVTTTAPSASAIAPPTPGSSEPAASSQAASPPSDTAAALPSAPPETPAPEQRHVVDQLTAPNVAFTIDYNDSGPKQSAEKTCATNGDDLQARATCMGKERTHFVADVLVFTKEAKGFSFVIYRRDVNNLSEVSSSTIDFKNETGSNVAVQVKSDKGRRPLFAGSKSFVVSAPPGSNIELDDPVLGHLVYEAKIGLVNKGD